MKISPRVSAASYRQPVGPRVPGANRACALVRMITVSIVSHAHGAMVGHLVDALLTCPEIAQVVVTLNVPEPLSLVADDRVSVIRNESPRGFGANHNAAFASCRETFFCPLNPDVELRSNPFPDLLETLVNNDAALIAPLVISPQGEVEDSVRRFPTLRTLLAKALGGQDGRYSLVPGQRSFFPEWVAGMFMLFRAADFARLGGFDEGFFLYYEDVDICARAWKAGMKVMVCPEIHVVHDARRDSYRSLRHLRWHLTSIGRYFWKHWQRLPGVDETLAVVGR